MTIDVNIILARILKELEVEKLLQLSFKEQEKILILKMSC